MELKNFIERISEQVKNDIYDSIVAGYNASLTSYKTKCGIIEVDVNSKEDCEVSILSDDDDKFGTEYLNFSVFIEGKMPTWREVEDAVEEEQECYYGYSWEA